MNRPTGEEPVLTAWKVVGVALLVLLACILLMVW